MSERRRKGRNISGLLLLDKPGGIGSNTALQRVKHLYNANKAGHTGNLDPLATGMLPICLGEATKISGFLLDADKQYRAECRLGITTDTGDAEGRVIDEKPVPELSVRRIEQALAQFRGEIEQVPPMYSALKHQGQPLYKLARQGLKIEREARKVTIYELKLLDWTRDSLKLDVVCSKGTYIRTLAEDIGAVLGCGAHLTALRRLSSGPFQESGMVDFDTLSRLATQQDFAGLDDLLLPVDAALPDWPQATVDATITAYLRQGQAVWLPGSPTEGLLRLYGRESDGGTVFIGIGQVLDDGRIAPKRLILAEK
jgi:tRNA pseudouridine55 synthase